MVNISYHCCSCCLPVDTRDSISAPTQPDQVKTSWAFHDFSQPRQKQKRAATTQLSCGLATPHIIYKDNVDIYLYSTNSVIHNWYLPSLASRSQFWQRSQKSQKSWKSNVENLIRTPSGKKNMHKYICIYIYTHIYIFIYNINIYVYIYIYFVTCFVI